MRGTATPAKILGYEGTVGTLKPGANTDIAVFELRDGTFPLRDSDDNTINARPVPKRRQIVNRRHPDSALSD
jgi:predicted amidohydrolase